MIVAVHSFIKGTYCLGSGDLVQEKHLKPSVMKCILVMKYSKLRDFTLTFQKQGQPFCTVNKMADHVEIRGSL